MSVFTRVPIDEALAVVAQRLEEDDILLEQTPYPFENIHSLAQIWLKTTYFQYQDSYNKQIEGAAMAPRYHLSSQTYTWNTLSGLQWTHQASSQSFDADMLATPTLHAHDIYGFIY